jgi:acetylornithine deacetylase/succinyl-diaminopimelate desuccinylase-like protein
MDFTITKKFIDEEFESQLIPGLSEFITIPNLSPLFDPDWQTNGHLEKAAKFLISWAKSQGLKNATYELIKEDNRTPLILIEIDDFVLEDNESNKNKKKTTLIYGHYDKQSHYSDWGIGLSPVKPVINGDWLFGRGAADDGYSLFSAILAVKCIQKQNKTHGRIIILIEGCEESGSIDLLNYLDSNSNKIPTDIDLIISLDSGCLNYERLWLNTSQRGIIIVDIKVQVLEEGVHSGTGSGIVPDSFMIIRNLLDRIEDPSTMKVILKELQIDPIPKNRIEDAQKIAEEMKNDTNLSKNFKLLPGVVPICEDVQELILNNTWRPTVTITGASDLPPHKIAGNILKQSMGVRLSLRLPPSKSCVEASEILCNMITKNPPFNCKIKVKPIYASTGWNVGELSPKLNQALDNSCEEVFGKNYLNYGDGGSNSFMSKLVENYPRSEFLVLGVLGPGSNTHSTNEALNLPYCKKLLAVIAHTINNFNQ